MVAYTRAEENNITISSDMILTDFLSNITVTYIVLSSARFLIMAYLGINIVLPFDYRYSYCIGDDDGL